MRPCFIILKLKLRSNGQPKRKKQLQPNQLEKSTKPPTIKRQVNEINAEEEKMERTDSCTIQHAGIVLIWPMLRTLFEDRGIMENNAFLNERCKFKALQLLNFICNGSDEMEEHEMPLNKLLCQLSIQTPVPILPPLANDDKAECNALLTHVIKNWTVLKSTSVEGLRASFIQRSAELYEDDDSLTLKVEQKGIDILLDKLPWGFRMIKLPWMQKLIHVEW